MYAQQHELGNNHYYQNGTTSKEELGNNQYYQNVTRPKEVKKSFSKSTEKFMNKSKKNLTLFLTTVVKLITPAPPPPVPDVVFMTYVIRVDKQVDGWQKSLLAVLKKTAIVKDFTLGEGGRVIVSAAADLKTFLKGVGKAKAKVEWIQTSKCSSRLLVPQIGGHGYGYGYGYGGGEYYNGTYPMYPFHGGYGGVQDQRGFGYNPMGYGNNYMPFNNGQGVNYMAAPQAQRPLMNDVRMDNCPCEL